MRLVGFSSDIYVIHGLALWLAGYLAAVDAIAYAIGIARPVSVMIETFGTALVSEEKISAAVDKLVDLRPAAIIEKFDLRKPIYKDLAAYGHMGREELGVKWEECDIADKLRELCL